MWLFVAPALGFDVIRIRTRPSPFLDSLGSLFNGAAVLTGRPRFNHPQRIPDLVFSDFSGIPPTSFTSYWERWVIPHLFHFGSADRPLSPDGWSLRTLNLSHYSVGGTTDYSSRVGILLPPSLTGSNVSTPSYPLQPWRPLLGLLDSSLGGSPIDPPSRALNLGPVPCWTGSRPPVLLPWGLLPTGDPLFRCACPSVFSPTKWVLRTITPAELAGAWDLPISVVDLARQRHALPTLLCFGNNPPGKILYAGADLLLSIHLPGGGELFHGRSFPHDRSCSPFTKTLRPFDTF
jgi:hypothetical protein